MSIEKTLVVNELFDTYGSLLTQHQQEVVRLYFHEDFSYQEIADILQISRAGVYDVIKRSVDFLEDTEKKLKIVELHNTLYDSLSVLEIDAVTQIIEKYLKGGNYE